MVVAAYHLYKSDTCEHPAFKAIGSWSELCQLAEARQAENLGPFVKLVMEHKDNIPELCAAIAARATSKESEARVVLSTVHTYKGREAPSVRLANDFGPFCRINPVSKQFELLAEEANIAYVAVTRAMDVLDLAGYKAVLEDSLANLRRMRQAHAHHDDVRPLNEVFTTKVATGNV
jgi:superfamily I DNA/RNA helicase